MAPTAVPLLLLVSLGCRPARGATHWAVTHDGQIQAVDDSYFDMRQPHHLVEFLRQERRVARLRRMETDGQQWSVHTLDTMRRGGKVEWTKTIDSVEGLPAECRDMDAMDGHKPLSYTVTSSALSLDTFGFHSETFIGRRRSVPDGKTPLQPYCDNYYKLPFSMHAFEHLHSLHSSKRWLLEIEPITDRDLIARMLSNWPSASDFGHHVTLSLKETPTSWVLHNMATFYWRVVGNGPEAVECARRSLHLTPWRYQPVPMLNLANVLMQTHHVDDAVVVLDSLLAVNDTVAAAYCKSAEAYAMQDNQNASIYAYDACMLLEPDFANARPSRARAVCDEALHRRAIEADGGEEAAQEMIAKVREYKQMQVEILSKAVSAAERRNQQLAYDYLTYGNIGSLQCDIKQEAKSKSDYLACSVANMDQHQMLRDIVHEQAFGTRSYGDADDADSGTSVDWGNPQMVTHMGAASGPLDPSPAAAHEHLSQDAFVADLAQTIRLRTTQFLFENASFAERYPLGEEGYYDKDMSFVAAAWPARRECAAELSQPFSMATPQLFMSPAEKGFPVGSWLTDRMGLGDGRMHPLPWYPPSCVQDTPLDAPICDALLGVQRVKNMPYAPAFAEMLLEPTFLDLVAGVSDSVAEVGQRVNTALTLNLAPHWVLLNLAGLYWRIKGVPQEAVACLRQALIVSERSGMTEAVMTYRDVTLVQLAQIVDIAGDRLDDSILLLRRALLIGQYQPQSHYLLATYLARRGNLTGAASHLRLALILQPDLPGALADFKKLMCELKFGTRRPAGSAKGAYRLEPLDAQYEALVELATSCANNMQAPHAAGGGAPLGTSIPLAVYLDAVFKPLCLAPRSFDGFGKAPGATSGLGHFCIMIKRATDWAEQCLMHTGGILAPVTYTSQGVPCVRPSPVVALLYPLSPAVTAQEHGSQRTAGHKPTSSTGTGGDDEEEEDAPVQPDEDEGAEVTLDFDNSAQHEAGRRHAAAGHRWGPPPGKLIVTYPAPETAGGESDEDAGAGKSASPAAAKSSSSGNGGTEVYVRDTELPEVLPRPDAGTVLAGVKLVGKLPSTSDECAKLKDRVNLESATSTWLSVTARGVDLYDVLQFNMIVEEKSARVEPVCPEVSSVKMWLLDHLAAFQHLEKISQRYSPETGLKDAFENLGPQREESSLMATRMTLAMMNSRRLADQHDWDGGVPWSLSTVAALYWRVKGDAKQAVKCLRHALANSPASAHNYREPALISLANIYHRMAMHRSALIAAGTALAAGPKTVVTHFTLANIYAGMGNLELASQFYLSTLALQNNFEPARDRLKAIYCLTGQLPTEAISAE